MMIVLTHPLPPVARQKQTVIIRGEAKRLSDVRIELEGKRMYVKPAPPWKVLAAVGTTSGGRFALRWRVAPHERVGPISLRVVARRVRRVVAATRPSRSWVGPAPVYCAAPPPIMQDIPVGDGWITGGDYIEGGPYPGIYRCESQTYTVTASNRAGQVLSRQRVCGCQSYALFLPAGHYRLTVSPCGSGQATVTAGEGTHADSACPVP